MAFVLVPPFMLLVMTPTLGTQGGSRMLQGLLVGGPVPPRLSALLWLVVSVAIIGIGLFLHGAIRTTGTRQPDPAIQELRIAYARGELSDEEFETRLERLQREE